MDVSSRGIGVYMLRFKTSSDCVHTRVHPGRPASHEDAEAFANRLIALADHYPRDGSVSLDELLACERCLILACDGSEYTYGADLK